MAGTGAVAAVLIGGLIAAVATYLYAELGAAFPQAGGVYPSLVGVLGPFCAFPYITMMMAAPTVTAFGLLGFADYVRVLAPGLPEVPVALACLAPGCAVAKPLPAAILGLAVVSAISTCSGAHWALYFSEELKDARGKPCARAKFTAVLCRGFIEAP